MCTDDPLDLKLLVVFKWLVIPFLSINAFFSTSIVVGVSVSSFLSISEFLVLFKKTSLIHSSSPADMPHFSPLGLRRPRIVPMILFHVVFFKLFNSLFLSNVTFVFLTNDAAKFSQNPLKEI